MRTSIILTVGALAVLLLGLAVWIAPRSASPAPQDAQADNAFADAQGTPQSTSALPDINTPPAGYSKYSNGQYHFALIYPSELAVKTYDEGGGAMTITFQNTVEAVGFQVFIVPYTGTTVTEERFMQDEPSGVRTQVTNTTVGGTQAVSFYGNNAVLGDTAETWFINGGYLYEVTTLKPLASWMTHSVQTWTFI